MLDAIRSLLTADENESGVPTPGTVQEAIAETDAKLNDARTRLERLEDQHADLLLEASDEEIDEHEAEIEAAKRTIARLGVARERLEGKLEEAKEAQEERKKQEKFERGQELREEFAGLRDDYAELVEEMVPILERMQEIDEEVKRLRHEVGTGPNRECVPPGSDAFPNPNRAPYQINQIAPSGPGSPFFEVYGWRKQAGRSSRSKSRSGEERSPGPRIVDPETGEEVDSLGGRGRRSRRGRVG